MTTAKTMKREVRSRMARTGEKYTQALEAIRRMNVLDRWRERVVQITYDRLGIGDIWDDSDPYDVGGVFLDALANGQSPRDFVQEIFAEDFAAQEYDEGLRIQSEEESDDV